MAAPSYIHCLVLPTPFPVGPVNVYLIEGEPLTLVDTGPKADVTRAALETGLASLGYQLADLRRILITHHHVDHMGLAAEIVERSGAAVLTHRFNVGWLSDYGAQRALQRPFFAGLWREAGVPEQIVQAMETAGDDVARWRDPVKPDGLLDEGDSITLGHERWHVFHTPGHAGGLICLWEPTTRTLLANDHFIVEIVSSPVLEPPQHLPGPRPKRLVEYLTHMQRMALLHPQRALSGHGGPVLDVSELVRQRVALSQRRAARLLETLAADGTTAWELTQKLHPRLQHGMGYFLGLSNVLGHLDLLERDGRAAPATVAGRQKWRRL